MLVADLFIWFGSLKIIIVFVVMLSDKCSGYSPAKYSSKRSISLFCKIHLVASCTISLVAYENPKVASLYIFLLYLAISAYSVGSTSCGHPPSLCFIPFDAVGILSVFTYYNFK
jgi:hypothetical protein